MSMLSCLSTRLRGRPRLSVLDLSTHGLAERSIVVKSQVSSLRGVRVSGGYFHREMPRSLTWRSPSLRV